MGGLCCCPTPCDDELEEYGVNGQPICLRFLFHHLFAGYSAAFQRLDDRSVSPPVQGASALVPLGMTPPPLPNDSDQRFSRLQRDGLVSRRDKSSTHFQEDSQLRRNTSSLCAEENCKFGHTDSSEKASVTKVANGLTYVQSSSEDEDVCPTCLDEYTPENPKITTRCSHHFHLGCIYEWLERSENCPVCGKEMEFCESP